MSIELKIQHNLKLIQKYPLITTQIDQVLAKRNNINIPQDKRDRFNRKIKLTQRKDILFEYQSQNIQSRNIETAIKQSSRINNQRDQDIHIKTNTNQKNINDIQKFERDNQQPQPQKQIVIGQVQRNIEEDNDSDIDNILIPSSLKIPHHDHNHLTIPGQDDDSFQFQTQIQNNGPPLEAYQNFTKRSLLNSQQKYQTQNPLKAIQFWLIDILYSQRVQVIFDIKRSFIKGDFQYIMKIFSQAHIIHEYGGEDTDQQTIKKLFVQFIYKKQQESTIKFIQKYTILQAVIELAIVYYIMCSSEPQVSDRFLSIYQNGCKQIKQFYEIIAKVFNLKFNNLDDKVFILESQDKHILVKVNADGILESEIK